MRIAVVGCGAVGSFYGGMLARNGGDVHFLLRSDFAQVRDHGVLIRSAGTESVVRPGAARSPEEIGPVNLVIVALKTTANDEFPNLISPLLNPETAILTLQNGLGNEEQLAVLFGAQRVLGGLCFVCLNRVAPGVIHHLAHGQIVLGEFQRKPQPRTHLIADMFQRADVACSVAEDLAKVHWEKLVWNIPFNGLGVAGTAGLEAVLSGHVRPGKPPGPCLTTDILLNDAAWTRVVRELMMEVIHGARALGMDVQDSVADAQIERTRSMGPYKASTLIDFERGCPLELNSMFEEPLRQARGAGCEMPRLTALCAVLRRIAP